MVLNLVAMLDWDIPDLPEQMLKFSLAAVDYTFSA